MNCDAVALHDGVIGIGQWSEFQMSFTAGIAMVPQLASKVGLRMFALAACAGIAIHATPAAAATIPVSNCNDSGPGSLRAAVAMASDGDTIDMSGTPSCVVINLTSGQVEIPQNNLNIVGRRGLPVFIDSNLTSRLLHHSGTGTLSLFGLFLRFGRHASNFALGGCLLSEGHVEVDATTFEHCEAVGEGGPDAMALGGAVHANTLRAYNTRFDVNNASGINGNGGAISTEGRVTLHLVTLGGNSASNGGGAIFTLGGATLTYSFILSSRAFRDNGGLQASGGSVTINKSVVSGNRADRRCGGICITGSGRTTILDSTITRNSAVFLGAGELSDDATISNSTVVSNTDTSGSECVGVLRARNLRLESTIVANNTCLAAGQSAYDIGGRAWEGYTLTGDDNLIERSRVAVPTDTISADPMLDVFADNGGVSVTYALLPGSPAIDRGNNKANRLYDQRGPGFPRVVGPRADIGAFEVQAAD
jgi:hypothetical protein